MRSLLPLSLLLLLAASPLSLRAAGLEELIGEHNADRRDLHASALVPWSLESMDREEMQVQEWLRRLDMLDYAPLDATARIDWHLLHTQLVERHDELSLSRHQLDEMQPLLAFAAPVQQLLKERAQRHLADPEAAATALARCLADLKAQRKPGKNDNTPPPSAVLALRTAGAIDELRTGLAAWYGLYDGFQPEFNWWVSKPYEELTKEMASYSGYLRKDLAGQKGEPGDPLVGDPIGAEAIRSSLAAEMIPYTAEELIAIAEKQFAWCEAEMTKAAHDLGCASGPEAVAKIKDHHAPPGGQAAFALSEAQKAIAFVKDHDLVTIPPLVEETWGIAMLGPEQQKSLPYAVYGQPRIMVAYAAESMTHEDKLESMRGNNAAFLHIVTPHELIPGHHLQGFMARRYAAYRSSFYTPFLVEGWALHWEMLLWDQGYVATPEEKVGALFWRMHRCARIITTLKFHLGQMTPAQMIDFLVDRVGHERSGATSEVRRYIGGSYGPLYQVAYMTGGLQLGALQREICRQNEDGSPAPATNGIQRQRATLREFHDAVLKEGPVPIEMIRAALRHDELPKEWKPAWRFADS